MIEKINYVMSVSYSPRQVALYLFYAPDHPLCRL
ncbi:hypothetical protein Pvag_1591 [Pantoea vagans C9-1]|nr:hypothetical protein Pvag_1591 [Pantoea vagans C9-1]